MSIEAVNGFWILDPVLASAASPDFVVRLHGWIDRGAARVAHLDGQIVEALAVGPAP
ncbi:hypothetical protein ND748_00280 [Frankia sp. AiPs1]|uniref:hypothetical protein n=1 Tax=Frankia sp. AiPs1 TaxID=573493 RepID=UPI00204327A4|nr:hypothetical protein [Frankia sp. AiPs1]MCM3920133.1 hypothetical protein [Frankia sp. AiPs1]